MPPEDCRVEVLDGALIATPRPRPIHRRIIRRLSSALEPQLAEGWQLEIDVDVFDAALPLTTRPIPGNAILLAVEVVSRRSRREDRGSKRLVTTLVTPDLTALG